MFKSRWLICLFMVAAGLEGCQWNSELYQAYVNEKDGNVEVCNGACDVSLNQEDCQKFEGQWIAAKCDILNDGDVDNTNSDAINDLASCRTAGGVWSEAYCQIELNNREKCDAVRGNWAEYHMLDLGNGLYIRKITHEDNSEQFICGSYALVITNHQNASSCKQEDIDKFIQSQKYLICPVGTTCQLAYQQEIESEDNEQNEENINSKENLVAICSSCPQNSIMCRNTQGEFVCTYIESDAENCGECGNKCEDGYSCAGGECVETEVEIYICPDDTQQCGVYEDGKPKCYNFSSPKYCNPRCDEDEFLYETCGDAEICEDKQCKCLYAATDGDATGACTVENDTQTRCLNPASNESCGATGCNDNGMICPNNALCKPNDSSDKPSFECKCNDGFLKVTEDGKMRCVNSMVDSKYCGLNQNEVDSGMTHYCPDNSHCSYGICECNEYYISCDGQCIRPELSNDYCGAKGLCNNPDANSDNFRGKVCLAGTICETGVCICDERAGYISYEGKCVHPSHAKTCGATQTFIGEDCTSFNGTCELQDSQKYACDCPDGLLKCSIGDASGSKYECIDPKSNNEHCGAKGSCIGDDETALDFAGVTCGIDVPICYNSSCTVNCPSGQVVCDGKCVDPNEYHINMECTACQDEYCYLGEQGEGTKFDYRLCKTFDDSNKLNSVNHCGGCVPVSSADMGNQNSDNDNVELIGQVCQGGKLCTSESDKFICACPKGTIECNGRCVNSNDVNVNLECTNCLEGYCYLGEVDDLGNPVKFNETLCKYPNDSELLFSLGMSECRVCDVFHMNVNNDWKDGCEIDTRTDVNHCGTADLYVNCQETLQYVSGIACMNSVCNYGTCLETHCDNNGVRTDGCEFLSENTIYSCGCEKKKCDLKCDYSGCDNLCENGVCCVKGELHKNMNNVTCCDGYELYKYSYDYWVGCKSSSHYGCFKPEEAEGLSNCWSKVSQ